MTFEYAWAVLRPHMQDTSDAGRNLGKRLYDGTARRLAEHVSIVNHLARDIDESYYFPAHDADKFQCPYYLLETWELGGRLIEDIVKDAEQVRCLFKEVQRRHAFVNTHHPEFWNHPWSRTSEQGVDVRSMTHLAVVEFVCDRIASSDLGVSYEARTWFEENISSSQDKRWWFTEKQQQLIYDILEWIYEKRDLPIIRTALLHAASP